MAILLHFFVEAKNTKAAKATARAVLDALRVWAVGCRISTSPPKPYWKIEGQYDVGMRIVPPRGKQAREIQRQLVSGLAEGWHWSPNGTSATWRQDKERRFKVPGVCWAHFDIE